MYLTGFADEAGRELDAQIRATLELGWQYIEARKLIADFIETKTEYEATSGKFIHDISDREFDIIAGKLDDAGIKVNCFGSGIANASNSILKPFDRTLAEASKCIPRMQRLETKLVRIMSYPILKDREPDDQMEDERFRRLRELQKMFAGAGQTMVHENCMNYGGMSSQHTLRLLENVPGLKLVFDTGNPVHSDNLSSPRPYPKQSSWEFYSQVKEHIAYVHIKDVNWNPDTEKAIPCFPGEGMADIRKIVRDLLFNGYEGGFSIEPHIGLIFHDPTKYSEGEELYRIYVEYGRRTEKLLAELK